MERVDRVRVDPSAPRRVSREQVEAILSQISPNQKRDRLLFRLMFETGVRIGEALALHVEDIDLTLDDEHITVVGKGKKRHTVLLNDPRLVTALRQYLNQTGYKHGPLFRAQKNGSGGHPLPIGANPVGQVLCGGGDCLYTSSVAPCARD